MLEEESDAGLRVYVVWLPVLPQAKAGMGSLAARRESNRVPDRRARHFYDESATLGRLFREPLGLPENSVAWDVFLIFAPGEAWTNELPRTNFWMHQLSARWWREQDREAAAQRRLNADELLRHIQELTRKERRAAHP